MTEIFKEEEIRLMSDLIVEESTNRSSEVDVTRFKLGRAAQTNRILGKTLEEWKEYFTIKITYPSMPHDVMRYCADWSRMNDVAYNARAKLQNELKIYTMSYSQKISDEISKHALNKSRKVMPAADTLREVAQAQMGIRYDILIQYEKEIEFFSEMIYKLKDTLKAISIIGMSNGTQLKGELGYQ